MENTVLHSTKERPSVGIAILVIKNHKILLGKDLRKGDVFGVPGGHWESGETLKECAIREVREESGVICKNPTLVSLYDFYREDKGRSYVTIGMRADYVSGELANLEEEKRMDWGWYTTEEALKLNLFPPDKILIERFISGTIYQ